MSITRSASRSLAAALVVFVLAGCGKKEIPPVPVGEMVDYKDPGYGFHIQYPKGWMANAEVGRAQFFSAQDVDKRFLDPDGGFPDGVMIAATLTKTTSPDVQRDSVIAQKTAMGYQITQPEQITIADKPATSYHYTARYHSGMESGEYVFINVDTALYLIHFAGFGDIAKAHKDVFAASLKTFQFPKAVPKGADATLPSETYTDGELKVGDKHFFTYSYPDNFNYANPPKGSFELSVELRAYRQDCSVRFDVFDAKGANIDMVFDQNKGKYRPTGTGKASIGGEQAQYVAYVPSKDVSSRAYFVVHAGKAFRITTNWYKPQEKEYLGVFDKVLTSIKFK